LPAVWLHDPLCARFPADPHRATATISLFALKVSGLVFDGGYTLAERLQGRNKTDMQITTAASVPDYPKIVIDDRLANSDVPNSPGAAPNSWAKQMFGYGEALKGDVTGSVGADEKPKGDPLKASEKAPEPAN